MKKSINYITGDATDPIVTAGHRFIAHGCNDLGAWGAGFTAALDAKSQLPHAHYQIWVGGNGLTTPFRGGEIIAAPFVDDLIVVNMITQQGVRGLGNDHPLRYSWLCKCLIKLRQLANSYPDSTVHMPRIGCGLAGGQWGGGVEVAVQGLLSNHGVDVYVYDLPTPR